MVIVEFLKDYKKYKKGHKLDVEENNAEKFVNAGIIKYVEQPTRKIPKQLCRKEFRFLKLQPKGKAPTSDMVGWQKKNLQFDSYDLLQHISKGGNYGIIGGYGNLVIIDADSPEVEKIAETLQPTFTIQTGSPEGYKKHYYFLVEDQDETN